MESTLASLDGQDESIFLLLLFVSLRGNEDYIDLTEGDRSSL
jgi:hypothetical protein